MKHPASRDLYQHWNALRGTRAAAEHAQMQPSGLRRLLADVLMVDRLPGEAATIRIAGSRICALIGREFRGTSLRDLFATPYRREAEAMLEEVFTDSIPNLIQARGRTADGRCVELELLILPLLDNGRPGRHAVATLVPVSVPYWIGIVPIWGIELAGHISPVPKLSLVWSADAR